MKTILIILFSINLIFSIIHTLSGNGWGWVSASLGWLAAILVDTKKEK